MSEDWYRRWNLMKKGIALLLAGALVFGTGGFQNVFVREVKAEENEGSTDGETEDAPALSVEVQTVSTGETDMDYITFGNGDKKFVIIPGLSVHSVMGLADSIAEAYEAFTEDYTVYLFDRPEELKEDTTIRDLASETAEAMKALDIEDAYLFGASQGGMIAQYLAIDHPELVNRMVLGSTLSRPNATFEKVAGEWIQMAEKKDEEGLIGGFVDDVYSEATLETYRDTLISSNLGIIDEEYQRFIILAKACLSFDCYEELGLITCPVLVLGSEGDQVVTAEGSEELADALGCELYLYDDSYGHGVYDEASDYKQRCLDFFAEEE